MGNKSRYLYYFSPYYKIKNCKLKYIILNKHKNTITQYSFHKKTVSVDIIITTLI